MLRFCILILLCITFYVGFFTSTISPKYILFCGDKVIHFIVFFIYPILFFLLLPKHKLKGVFLFLLFLLLSFFVEVLQRKFFNRVYCMTDFKYSLAGVFYSFSTIYYSKYLSYASKAKSY
jgi:hypothetical protein